MGKLYETRANKLDEGNAIAALNSKGYCVIPLGKLSPADFVLFKGGRSALVEFKRRNNPINQYPTVIIPEQKLRKCLCLAEEMSVGFLYLVQFDDGLFYASISDYSVRMGGRTDRGDPRDIHKVAHINTSDFRRLA